MCMQDKHTHVLLTKGGYCSAGEIICRVRWKLGIKMTKTKSNLKKIINCKCDYLLTSGQKENVDLGLKNISKILKQVNHQIKIIAGGGVNIKNVVNLYKLGIREFHLSGTDQKKAKPLETRYKLIKEGVDKLKLIKK